MKKNSIIYLFGVLMAALCITSCGSEDPLTPDYKNPSSYFMPSDDDNSELAQLRRKFFADHGSYLLFNDTIQKEFLGKDINGDPRYFVETVDLTYTVGQSGYGTSQSSYTFTYITEFEKQKAMTEFLENKILPHFTGSMKPYSWFLSNVITGKLGRVVDSQTVTPYAVVNQRCVAIACNYLTQRQRTEAQINNYTARVLNIIVGTLVKAQEQAFGEFEKISYEYYGRSYTSLGITGSLSQTDLYKYGFLVGGSTVVSMCDASRDIAAYASNVVQYSEEEIERKYGNYPLVMEKHQIMRRILQSLGYIF
ncbi:MAG: hypothetical protein IJ582_01205 [Prevotella sp.]|nr:hypothetical protein [Prevotella sp.]